MVGTKRGTLLKTCKHARDEAIDVRGRLSERSQHYLMSPTALGIAITKADTINVTATAQRRRREAKLDKRFKPKISERRSLQFSARPRRNNDLMVRFCLVGG